MIHEDEWALRLAIPLALFLLLIYLFQPASISGFVIHDSKVHYDPLSPSQVHQLSALLVKNVVGYQNFSTSAPAYTFSCLNSNNVPFIESYNRSNFSNDYIFARAKQECVGPIIWRGGK